MSTPVFALVVCTLGGLLLGVLVKVFGDHSGIFTEMMLEFGKTGRFNYRHAPGAITALTSFIAGGSLGTLTANKLKLDERETRSLGFSGLSGMLAAFNTSPFSGALFGLASARAGVDYAWALFPSLVSLAFATVAFVALSGTFFGALFIVWFGALAGDRGSGAT